VGGSEAVDGTGSDPASAESIEPRVIEPRVEVPELVPILPPAARAGVPARATMAMSTVPMPTVAMPTPDLPPPLPRSSTATIDVDPVDRRAASDGWADEGLHAVHRATSQQIRAGRHRSSRPPQPWPVRIVRWALLALLAAIVVGAVVAAVVGVRAMLRLDDLPTYGADRPDFGTVSMRTEIGNRATVEITANADRTHYLGVVDGPSGRVEIVRVPGATYGADAAERVREQSVAAATEVGTALDLAGLLIFSDVVPDEAREYTSLDSRANVVIDGRELRQLELHVDDAAFRRADPEAYRDWRVLTRAPARPDLLSDGVQLVVSVDDDGVVWRMDSSPDAPGDQYDLLAWSPEPFAATIPASFAPLPIEDQGPDVCESQRGRLEAAAAAWLADEGSPLRFESEAIPEYLGSYVSEFDVIDGVVVATAGGACD
jgi:hypothetical protein